MRTQQAIEHFGSATKLADALKIHKSAVSQWEEYPPIGRQYQLQAITNGKLKAEKHKQVSH